MNATTVLAAKKSYQISLYIITMLELTGYLFSPPALLRDGDIFDYIIVGGGTAGSVIATRLAQKKYNVLLIEAGEDAPYESVVPALSPYLDNSHVDWNYTSYPDGYNYQCQKNNVIDLGIGKMLGGTSELNYNVYSRGNRRNFNEWAKITNDPTWLWENVLPYFIKSENVSDSAIENSPVKNTFGTKGYIGVTRDMEPITGQFLEGFRQVGKDIIDDIDGNRHGYSRGLITIKDGSRQGAGTSYLGKITENRYIAVAKNTLVTKININIFKWAVGVDLITDEGKRITVRANQEIILAAGAIKTPQLLMLSGIGPEEELRKFNIRCINNLPVGKDLQDHIAAFIPYKTNVTVVTEPRDSGKYPSGLFVGYASLHYPSDYIMYPDYNVIGHIELDTMNLLLFCLAKFPVEMCNRLSDEAGDNQVLIVLLTDLRARSRGQVTLRSTNPMDSPKVLPDGFSYDRDLDSLVDYIYDFMKVEKSEAFNKLGVTRIDLTSPRCDDFNKDSREYWRCNVLCMMVSLKTFAGTCAMGTVVDSRLRVLGIHGLRVADASIMPTIVSGVTSNTVLMIGEKVSDMIIEDAGLYNIVEHIKIRPDQIKNMPN